MKRHEDKPWRIVAALALVLAAAATCLAAFLFVRVENNLRLLERVTVANCNSNLVQDRNLKGLVRVSRPSVGSKEAQVRFDRFLAQPESKCLVELRRLVENRAPE